MPDNNKGGSTLHLECKRGLRVVQNSSQKMSQPPHGQLSTGGSQLQDWVQAGQEQTRFYRLEMFFDIKLIFCHYWSYN